MSAGAPARAAAPEAARPAVALLAAAGVLLAALAAVAAPLATYAVTLATLGLAHVLAELRYVDARFAPRFGRRAGPLIVALLAGVVALRAGGLAGAVPRGALVTLELAAVALLAAATLPALARRGRGPLAVGSAVVLALGAGLLLSPGATLVVLAGLHTLTPVGLLAERLRGEARRRALGACLAVFGGVPLLIASGLPEAALAAAAPALLAPDASPFAGLTLAANLPVYVPPPLLGSDLARHLFAAFAFLQVMHYAAVLHLLPRLDDEASWTGGALVPWPRRTWFTAGVVVAAVAVAPAFLAAFHDARSAYGLAAAVHAWLEVPALLVALAAPAADGA